MIFMKKYIQPMHYKIHFLPIWSLHAGVEEIVINASDLAERQPCRLPVYISLLQFCIYLHIFYLHVTY